MMTEWTKGNAKETRSTEGDLGGTMRLGSYPAQLTRGSRVADIYGSTRITERHRHRYEVNMEYRKVLEKNGLLFSGVIAGRHAPGDRRAHRPSVVYRRAVPPRAEEQAVRAAPAVRQLYCGRDGTEPAGLGTSSAVRRHRACGR